MNKTDHIRIKIIELVNKGDARGFSCNIPQSSIEFLKEIKDVHTAIIVPGAIRGNHYHVGRREVIGIWYQDSFMLAFDTGINTKLEIIEYEGSGLKLLEVDMESSHAIKNTGKKDLFIMAFSSKKYNPDKTDTFKRILI